MTDISPWRRAMFTMEITDTIPPPYASSQWNPVKYRYNVVPLNEYQIGNLVGALLRNHQLDNGDWYYELIHMALDYMDIFELKEIRSNYGDKFTREELQKNYMNKSWLV